MECGHRVTVLKAAASRCPSKSDFLSAGDASPNKKKITTGYTEKINEAFCVFRGFRGQKYQLRWQESAVQAAACRRTPNHP